MTVIPERGIKKSASRLRGRGGVGRVGEGGGQKKKKGAKGGGEEARVRINL